MQIKAKVTYDAKKLARNMPKMINGLLKAIAIKAEHESSVKLFGGELNPPLTQTTKKIRKQRGIIGKKPLYATGSLFDSIELKTTKDTAKISMWKYGVLHHKGFTTASNSMIPGKRVPKRPWIGVKASTMQKLAKNFSKGISRSFKKDSSGLPTFRTSKTKTGAKT